MTDQELADAVYDAGHALSDAISEARDAGLTVKVQFHEASFERGELITTVETKVARINALEYRPPNQRMS